jgi:hypothetical protein
MKDFPEFMKKSANRIGKESQYTDGIEGYVFTAPREARWRSGYVMKTGFQKNIPMSMTSTLSSLMGNIRSSSAVKKSHFDLVKNSIFQKVRHMLVDLSRVPAQFTALAGSESNK